MVEGEERGRQGGESREREGKRWRDREKGREKTERGRESVCVRMCVNFE